jgi:hypothetical protein
MMYLANANMIDLFRICRDARPDEIEQYEAFVGGAWDVDAVVNDLFNRSGTRFALMNDSVAIAVCGWEPVIDGVWQAWMVGTMENWEKYWRSITKLCRETVNIMFSNEGTRRLQIAVLASREKTCEWYVRGMKFHYESTMQQFGAEGEDVSIYVKLREH